MKGPRASLQWFFCLKELIFCLYFFTIDSAPGRSYHFFRFFSASVLTNPANHAFIKEHYRVTSTSKTQDVPLGM